MTMHVVVAALSARLRANLTRRASIVAAMCCLLAGCSSPNGSGGDAGSDARAAEGGVRRTITGEVCGNGADDNGDGQIDEACACLPGDSENCYPGPFVTRGVGACRDGRAMCSNGEELGTWGACSGATLPSPEICGDMVDNDCNGAVDEGCSPCPAGATRACAMEFDALDAPCHAGMQSCRDDGTWGECSGAVGPTPDVCGDRVDNDCNGTADDGCAIGGDGGVPPSDGGACTDSIAPPRPIAPLSVTRVTSQRPTLRWVNAAGADSARIELCADRACATVLATYDAAGSAFRSPVALPMRAVTFWRLRGRAGAAVGCATGPTWEFYVGPRDTTVDTTQPGFSDVNGDGLGELTTRGVGGTGATNTAPVYLGARPMPATTAFATLDWGAGSSAGPTFVETRGEDADGDGIADLVLNAAFSGPEASNGQFALFSGSATGAPTRGSVLMNAVSREVSAIGDVNRDGYGDFYIHGQRSAAETMEHETVYFGAASGPSATPAFRIDTPSFTGIAEGGDFDGDGYSDLAVPFFDPPMASMSADSGAWIYAGGPSGLSATRRSTIMASGTIGGAVALLATGDFNGDGYADVVIGQPVAIAPATDGTPRYVQGYGLYLGGPSGVAARPTLTDSTLCPFIPPGGTTTCSPIPTTIGDVNGDGYDDLAIFVDRTVHIRNGKPTGLSPTDDASFMPMLMSSADIHRWGDVNGDGFDDFTFTTSGSTGTEMRVYLGSAAGAPSSPNLVIVY
jgi:hypothetical protein